MVKIGTGGTQVEASRSKCWRVACAELDWAVGVWGNVRRMVRVAKLIVNPQIAKAITQTYQRGCWWFASRWFSEVATEMTFPL